MLAVEGCCKLLLNEKILDPQPFLQIILLKTNQIPQLTNQVNPNEERIKQNISIFLELYSRLNFENCKQLNLAALILIYGKINSENKSPEDKKLRSINHYQLLNQVMKLISQKENRIHGLFDMKREA